MITQNRKRLSTAAGQQTGLPHPLQSVLPYLTIGGLAGALGASGELRTTVWTAVLMASIVGGIGALAWSCIRRERLYSATDDWIAHRRGALPSPAVLRERSAMLTAAGHREMIARSLRRIVSQAEAPRRHSAQLPLDAAAVRSGAPGLLRVASEIASAGQQISARAVVLSEELITDPGSPVYRHASSTAAALDERLRQILFELERSY